MTVLLEAENLSKQYPLRSGSIFSKGKTIDAVKGVSFTLKAGESVGLVGESGCGKSTLARLLAKLELPTAGQIRHEGKPLENLRGDSLQRFRRSVQLIFQDPVGSLNPRMRIGETIAEPLVIHRLARGRELIKRTELLLQEVGLDPAWKNRLPHTLSGGQRQRVGIARALSLDPELLICDEPVSLLDLSVQAQVLKLFWDLKGKRNLTLFFISHNRRIVSALCDRILAMQLGRLVGEASQTI